MPFGGFDDFVWPVPLLNGRKPWVSSQWWTVREKGTKGERKHLGVDIMYPRAQNEKATAPDGSKLSYMPTDVPAIACGRGMVWSVQKLKNGYAVRLDHGNPYTTLYLHLSSIEEGIKKGVVVEPGTPLGNIGPGPTFMPKALRHLHFEVEVWGERGKKVQVNPEIGSWSIHKWKYFGWNVDGTTYTIAPSADDEKALAAAEKRAKTLPKSATPATAKVSQSGGGGIFLLTLLGFGLIVAASEG